MGRGFWVVTTAWVLAVVAGNAWLWGYAATAGASAEPWVTWPPGATIQREPGKPTLVMFAHPRCACTRASLTELSRLMVRVGDGVTAYVVFARPDGVDDAWMQTDSVERARNIPGVTVIVDTAHGEAEAFGAHTSGTVLLFDSAGTRVFNGGITAARGHEGDSTGQERIVALVHGGAPSGATPVYGCALADEHALGRAP